MSTSLAALPSLREVQIERARRSLLDFTRYTKPDYQVNWHHRILCGYLERFARGEIKRLMVFMPPRHGKSELVSRRLPAYILGRDPDASIIACSYGADLASQMNRDVQRVIDSERYAEVFPDTKLFGENIRTLARGNYLRNSDIFEVVGHAGFYRSAGVGGAITGLGCQYGIIDDPIKNAEEAASQTYRETRWEWYTSTFYTRLEKGAGILLTMTRWHQDDLAGRLLRLAAEDPQADQWTVVRFPALYEGGGGQDDPREIGEPLWPDKYSAETLATIRAVSSYQWSALYQQSPTDREGGMFRREWFRIIDAAPAGLRRARYWDLAATEAKRGSDPDWTVGALLGERDGVYYVLDIQRTRSTPAGVEALVKQTAELDGRDVPVYMEQEPGASGVNLIDHYARRVLQGYAFRGVKTSGSKETRAQPWSAAAEAGNVVLIRGPWLKDLLEEHDAFPRGQHDDIVDACAGAHAELSLRSRMSLTNIALDPDAGRRESPWRV